MRSFSVVLVCLASSSSSSIALAESDPAPAPVAAVPAAAPAPALTASTSGLRNGFSLSAGQEFGGDRDLTATLFGADWRIGWRINEPISIYLHSHMSFGSGKDNLTPQGGITGNFASALIAEYMLPMRLFVGGGGGYGILNNPNGPLAAARIGYYPMKLDAVTKARHLNITLDYRAYFANQGYGMVSQVSLSIGYDRF